MGRRGEGVISSMKKHAFVELVFLLFWPVILYLAVTKFIRS